MWEITCINLDLHKRMSMTAYAYERYKILKKHEPVELLLKEGPFLGQQGNVAHFVLAKDGEIGTTKSSLVFVLVQ